MAEMENYNIIDRTKRTVTDSKLGKLEIGTASWGEDFFSLYFDVDSVSDNLQKQIDKTIQEDAIKKFYEYEEKYRSYGVTPENLKMREVLKILTFAFDGGGKSSKFIVSAIDTVTENLEVDIEIPANVEEFNEELKGIVMKGIEKKLFG